MELQKFKLNNFRNFSYLNLEFSPKLNLIIGNNGSGKTNLIEAIYILALTKTFKSVYDSVLIKTGETKSLIEGTIYSKITNNYSVEITKDGKKVKIDNNNINRLSDYISKILIVSFNSNDLKMINDNPSIRRKLLNIEISQLNNQYLKYLNEYNKINKQRNALLKLLYVNRNSSLEFLNILTEKLVDYGLKIYEERSKFVNNINLLISKYFYLITNEEKLFINYKSDFINKSKEELLNKYKKLIDKDIILGKTTFGIHMDDIEFKLENQNLRDYGSEGQQKNAIIAFKLSEIELIKLQKNETPILLIDDLYSELDKYKIKNILNNLDLNIQTFITVTDLNKVSKKVKENAKIFIIKDGEVIEK